MIFALFKIFIKNIILFGSFTDNLKKGAKGILKNAGIILLAILCLSSFVGLFIYSTINSYDNYSEQGIQILVPITSVMLSMLIIFFFGFVTVATNYYSGAGEEQFLAMPLKPYDYFTAKFLTSWITDAGLSAILFLSSAIVYGYFEHLLTKPLFYAGILISSICIPFVAVFIIYVLLILLLKFVFIFRSKTFLTGISVFFTLCFSMSFSLINTNLQYINGETANFLINNKAIMLIAGLSTGNPLSIILLIFITALIFFVFLPALAPLYVETISKFSYGKAKKISKVENEKIISQETKEKNLFRALFWRDVKSVLREPVFLVNGPLWLFIFPVIFIFSFGISFVAGGDILFSELSYGIHKQINMMNDSVIQNIVKMVIIVSSVYTIFLGSLTNIAVTSFSREGKFLSSLKAMPIDNGVFLQAKFFHAYMYCIIGGIITALLLTLIYVISGFPFGFAVFCKIQMWSFLISETVLVFISFIDMFLDALNPKLQWENPSACVKQNLNSLFSMFFSILIVGLVLGIGLSVPGEYGLYTLLVLFIILSAVLGNLIFKYSLRKLKDM